MFQNRKNAVIDAQEAEMHSLLATKADVTAAVAEFKSDIAQLEVKLTVRMGLMLSSAVGVMLTAMEAML